METHREPMIVLLCGETFDKIKICQVYLYKTHNIIKVTFDKYTDKIYRGPV